MKRLPKRPKGLILHETDNIVIIATLSSANVKTGNMIQTWILPRHIHPSEAVKTGQDSLVCFDCKHRPSKGGACYVKVFQAPSQIWKSYHAGLYPKISDYGDSWTAFFRGRGVRFGAYGDPVLIPFKLVEKIASVCATFTGYTHQWHKKEYVKYRAYCMASTDNAMEESLAKSLGWRCFSVVNVGQSLEGSVQCPATMENSVVTCLACSLCKGNASKAKDVYVEVHGAKVKRFKRED